MSQDSYLRDRILVQLKAESHSRTKLPVEMYASSPSFGLEDLDKVFVQLGGKEVLRAHRPVTDTKWEEETGFNRWFIVQFQTDIDVFEAVRIFGAQPELEFAQIIAQGEYTLTPNDPYYSNHWGHNNTRQLLHYQNGSYTGSPVGVLGFDSKASLAWNNSQGFGSSSVIIAIIDTGVDTSHPDLRLVAGYDTYENDNNVNPNGASSGHGTCCAGIAAAKGNNNLGVIGIAGGCSVMPLKVSGATMFNTATVTNAITWATDHGAHIISMSFSFGSADYGTYPSMDNAINYAYDHGISLFASTGNANSSSIAYPAKHPKVIAVGAASPSGERKSPSSSDGSPWGSNYGSDTQDDRAAVTLMGPTILPTTDIIGVGGYTSTDYDMYFDGTSCSAPYVAGVAALIKSKYPAYTPAQIETLLKFTSTDMTVDGGIGWDRFTGYGMVNANAAVSWSGNFPQTCRITKPVDGENLVAGSINEVCVSVLDVTNTTKVEFFLGSSINPSHTDYTAPFTWSWNSMGLADGTYTIVAKAYSNFGGIVQNQIQVNLISAQGCVWLGTSSSEWTSHANWAFGNVPNSMTDVTIPAYTAYSPTINSVNLEVRNLEIKPGATLTFTTNPLLVNQNAIIAGKLSMSSGGLLRVLGTLTFKPGASSNISNTLAEIRAEGDVLFQAGTNFQMDGGKFSMQGSVSHTLISNSSSVTLNRLTINKPASSVIMSTPSSGTIVCAGITNLQAGSLIANANCNLILKYNLGGPGLLQMNNGTLWAGADNITLSLSSGSVLNNVGILGESSFTFLSNAVIKGNMEFGEGFISADDKILTVGGSWISSSLSQFSHYGSQVIFSGAGDQYIGFARFNNLTINKSSGNIIIPADRSVTATNLTSSQISGNLQIIGSLKVSQQCNLSVGALTVNGSLSLGSGTITVANAMSSTTGSSLTINSASIIMTRASTGAMSGIGGHLIMYGGLIESTNNGILFGINSSTSISGGTIRVGWDFNAPYPNTFRANSGTVELTGARFSSITMAEDNYFGNLLLNKPSNSYQFYVSSNISIQQDIMINGGVFTLNQYLLKVGRDLIINAGKLEAGNAASVIEVGRSWVNNSGIANFVEGSGTVQFVISESGQISTEKFNVVKVNRTGSQNYSLTIASGNTVSVAGGMNIISGRLNLGASSVLKLNNSSSLILGYTGELYAIGSETNNARITADSGYYAFTCNIGSILAAEYCIFERMDSDGINITGGASIDPLHCFRHCTFQNGISGGTLIKKYNNQTLLVDGAIFPTNTWGGSYNVYHSPTIGSLDFKNAIGAFCGAAYENDPSNRVFWSSSFPYNVNFESGDSGWTSGVISGTTQWQLGIPAKTKINTSHSGSNAWITNLSGDYCNNANIWLQSPELDFSGLLQPSFSVWLNIWCEAAHDGAILESSIDGGNTWQYVSGDLGFYNNLLSYGWTSSPKWSGLDASTDGIWTQFSTILAGLANKSSVYLRVRFGSGASGTYEGLALDDVRIWDASTEPSFTWAEDFTGVASGTLPTSWESLSPRWRVQASNYAGAIAPEMRFTGLDNSNGTFLVSSPVFNTSGISQLTLSFKLKTIHVSTPYNLRVYSQVGSELYLIYQWSPSSSLDAQTITCNLSTATHKLGSSDLSLVWRFSGNTDRLQYWSIDDIVLSNVIAPMSLEPIQNLTISKAPGAVQLSWTAVPNARCYRVYRSSNPYSTNWGTPIATPSIPTWSDIAGSDKYFYKVTASTVARDLSN